MEEQEECYQSPANVTEKFEVADLEGHSVGSVQVKVIMESQQDAALPCHSNEERGAVPDLGVEDHGQGPDDDAEMPGAASLEGHSVGSVQVNVMIQSHRDTAIPCRSDERRGAVGGHRVDDHGRGRAAHGDAHQVRQYTHVQMCRTGLSRGPLQLIHLQPLGTLKNILRIKPGYIELTYQLILPDFAEMGPHQLFKNGPRYQLQTWRDGSRRYLTYGSSYMIRMVNICDDTEVIKLPEECLRLEFGKTKALHLSSSRSRVLSEDWPFVDLWGTAKEVVWTLPDIDNSPGMAPPIAFVVPLSYLAIDVEDSVSKAFKEIEDAGGSMVTEMWSDVLHWYLYDTPTKLLVDLVSRLMNCSVEAVVIQAKRRDIIHNIVEQVHDVTGLSET